MPLSRISSDELAKICWVRLRTCEQALRRLVHDTLNREHGDGYLQTGSIGSDPLFNSEARRRATTRTASDPQRYPRPVDAIDLGDIARVLTKPATYGKYFKPVFADRFPLGSGQLRLTLDRLVNVRNPLSHANPISADDAAAVLYHCSELMSSLGDYYAKQGQAMEFHAPRFVRFTDSLGNRIEIIDDKPIYYDLKAKPLRPGDSLRLEAEVGAEFALSECEIEWTLPLRQQAFGPHVEIPLDVRHVSQHLRIAAKVVSNKPWHRNGTHDDWFAVVYKVLPPLD